MDLERELILHHQATVRAIETGRVDLAESRLKAYVQFAEAFLDAAGKYGVKFSAETAKSVSFFDWPTATQIGQYSWDGVVAAIRSGNRELIHMAANLPIDFFRMSTRRQDFLFFWKMTRLYPYILSLAYAVELTNVRPIVIDGSWRHFRDFTDYFLIDDTKSYKLDVRRQYIKIVLWGFSEMLKVAMDHNDVDTFGTLGRELNLLFRGLEVHGLDDTELETIRNYVGAERSLIWFGLGAWLVRSQVLHGTPRAPGQPDQKLVDEANSAGFMQVIGPLFDNIRQLSIAYHEAYRKQHGEHYWNNWLWQTLTEKEVHAIDFGTWLTWFYVIEGLRLSKSGSPLPVDIPQPDRELQYRMKEITECIGQIKERLEDWTALLPSFRTSKGDQAQVSEDRIDEATDYFLSANDLAVKEWRHLREDHVIDSLLAETRQEEFIAQCIKGWQEQSWAVQLFSMFRLLEERVAEHGATYTALTFLMPKDAFIEDPDSLFIGFGHDPGMWLGRDVSKAILEQLVSSGTVVQAQTDRPIVERVLSLIDDLGKGESTVVIVSGDFEVERAFLEHPEFVSRWREKVPPFDNPAYLGRLQSTLVFFLHNKERRGVIVISLEEAVRLLQYIPPEDNYKGLLIRITLIDQPEAEKLIKSQPDRMKDKEGNPRDQEEVIRELMTQVGIFIGAKIETQVTNPSKILYMPLQEAVVT